MAPCLEEDGELEVEGEQVTGSEVTALEVMASEVMALEVEVSEGTISTITIFIIGIIFLITAVAIMAATFNMALLTSLFTGMTKTPFRSQVARAWPSLSRGHPKSVSS